MKKAMISANSKYMREYFRVKGIKITELSTDIGHEQSYVSALLKKSQFPLAELKAICIITGMDYEKATAIEQSEQKETVNTENAELIISYIQDVGKILGDNVREVRETRDKTVEALNKLNATMSELMALLRSMASENRSFHVNTNNKLVELNNRLTGGR